MAKKKPYRRRQRVSKNKKRIQVHYGQVTHLFQADSFDVSEEGVLTITDDGVLVYANKNAWIYVMDLDGAQLLQEVQQTENQAPIETQESPAGPSSVMPGLEPA